MASNKLWMGSVTDYEEMIRIRLKLFGENLLCHGTIFSVLHIPENVDLIILVSCCRNVYYSSFVF